MRLIELLISPSSTARRTQKVATMGGRVRPIYFSVSLFFHSLYVCASVFLRKRLCVLIVSYFLTQSLFSLSHIIRERRKERAQYKRLTWWSEFDCVPQEWSKNFAAASPPLLLPHDFSSQRKRDRVYFPSEPPLLLYHNHLACGMRTRSERPSLFAEERIAVSKFSFSPHWYKNAATSEQRSVAND